MVTRGDMTAESGISAAERKSTVTMKTALPRGLTAECLLCAWHSPGPRCVPLTGPRTPQGRRHFTERMGEEAETLGGRQTARFSRSGVRTRAQDCQVCGYPGGLGPRTHLRPHGSFHKAALQCPRSHTDLPQGPAGHRLHLP